MFSRATAAGLIDPGSAGARAARADGQARAWAGRTQKLTSVRARPTLQPDVDDTKRAKREVDAETVAYVVRRYCGLDTSGSAFYLAAWESDDPSFASVSSGLVERQKNSSTFSRANPLLIQLTNVVIDLPRSVG